MDILVSVHFLNCDPRGPLKRSRRICPLMKLWGFLYQTLYIAWLSCTRDLCLIYVDYLAVMWSWWLYAIPSFHWYFNLFIHWVNLWHYWHRDRIYIIHENQTLVGLICFQDARNTINSSIEAIVVSKLFKSCALEHVHVMLFVFVCH